VHHLLDVYGAELHLAVDKASWRAIRRIVDEMDEDVPDAAGQVQFFQWEVADTGRTIPHYVIWLHLEGAFNDRDLVDTVAHEALHVGHCILEHAGVQEKGNMEALAYLTGWLTGWMWEHVCRSRKTAS
jgi:hypothetical protein